MSKPELDQDKVNEFYMSKQNRSLSQLREESMNQKDRDEYNKMMLDLLRKYEPVKMSNEKVNLPNGKYTVTWRAWQLEFENDCVKTLFGIRGTSIETVIVINGFVYQLPHIK